MATNRWKAQKLRPISKCSPLRVSVNLERPGGGARPILCRSSEKSRGEPPVIRTVSFENARAEELFLKAVRTTYGREKNAKRIGFPWLSADSRSETGAWNANCNDHIRQMDEDGNLTITEQKARSHSDSITSAKKAGSEDLRDEGVEVFLQVRVTVAVAVSGAIGGTGWVEGVVGFPSVRHAVAVDVLGSR